MPPLGFQPAWRGAEQTFFSTLPVTSGTRSSSRARQLSLRSVLL